MGFVFKLIEGKAKEVEQEYKLLLTNLSRQKLAFKAQILTVFGSFFFF